MVAATVSGSERRVVGGRWLLTGDRIDIAYAVAFVNLLYLWYLLHLLLLL